MICPLCSGKGVIPTRKVHWGDGVYKPDVCPACHGTGEVEEKETSKHHIVMYYTDYSVHKEGG